MSNKPYTYYFASGLFVAFILSPYIIPAMILAIMLMLRWGNYILPILAALFIDTSLAIDRTLYNLYGFIFTIPTILMSMILFKLRKFLKF